MSADEKLVTAWVLLALVYGGGRERASIDSIISAGDYLNHAILSYEEINEGLAYLLRRGMIARVGKEYQLEGEIANRYDQLKSRRVSLYWKETDAIICEWVELQKRAHSSVKPIRKHDYERAVRSYLKRNGI